MKKILIIEDNENNLYLISYILEKNGFEVIAAKNGLDGIEMATHENIDLIVMDIQLPDIDGHETTRRIRTAGVNLPIIALTSYALAGDKKKALDAGCTGYMTKPINPNTFVFEIKSYL